jgi:hypothetical protein
VGFLVDAWENLVEMEIMKFHGVGTGTTAEAAGNTALVTESTTALNPDSTRATGSLTEGAANVFITVGTLTFDASAATTEHGLFSQAATGGGVMWDRTMYSASTINVASGDSIQFTYGGTHGTPTGPVSGTPFGVYVVNNFTTTRLDTNAFSYENYLIPSMATRTTFELHLSKTHIKFGMPQYNAWWIDSAIPDLGWDRGVVQFGHHSYNPQKECQEGPDPYLHPGDPGCRAGTWHWDNLSISPSVPYTLIPATNRVADATTPTYTFPAPAPADSYLLVHGNAEHRRAEPGRRHDLGELPGPATRYVAGGACLGPRALVLGCDPGRHHQRPGQGPPVHGRPARSVRPRLDREPERAPDPDAGPTDQHASSSDEYPCPTDPGPADQHVGAAHGDAAAAHEYRRPTHGDGHAGYGDGRALGRADRLSGAGDPQRDAGAAQGVPVDGVRVSRCDRRQPRRHYQDDRHRLTDADHPRDQYARPGLEIRQGRCSIRLGVRRSWPDRPGA